MYCIFEVSAHGYGHVILMYCTFQVSAHGYGHVVLMYCTFQVSAHGYGHLAEGCTELQSLILNDMFSLDDNCVQVILFLQCSFSCKMFKDQPFNTKHNYICSFVSTKILILTLSLKFNLRCKYIGPKNIVQTLQFLKAFILKFDKYT